MRFSEWLNKLDKQQARLNDLALSEVSETISFPGPNGVGKVLTITIGKGKYECEMGKSGTFGSRYLRPLYTNNKEEFDAMLESITQQTDLVVQATEVILEAVSDEALPQAVIARMKGEKTSGDPADLVESMTEKKLKELLDYVYSALRTLEKVPATIFKQFQVDLEPVAGKALTLHYDSGLSLYIQWGRTQIADRRSISLNIPDVEEAMFFLANYDLIKERILRFLEQIKAIK